MIVIACDHGGYYLKEDIKKYLTENNISFKDIGTDSDKAVDYPHMAKDACGMIVSGDCDKAILICGTGIGMSIAANKIHGIRAAVVGDSFSAQATRAHNNANVLCLGERVIGFGVARNIVEVFLNTDFEGDRHQRRIDLISNIEKSY